jgi:hypothetical protein
LGGAQGETAQALAQRRYVEVDDEADGIAAELEIRHDLRDVERLEFDDGLELDYDLVADEHVDPICAIDARAVVVNVDGNLPSERHASLHELHRKTARSP